MSYLFAARCEVCNEPMVDHEGTPCTVPPKAPEIVWWHFANAARDQVILCWENDELRTTVLDVDHDVEGTAFHYASGDEIDPRDEDYEGLLWSLSGDMSALEGSQYIPIRAWYYRLGGGK